MKHRVALLILARGGGRRRAVRPGAASAALRRTAGAHRPRAPAVRRREPDRRRRRARAARRPAGLRTRRRLERQGSRPADDDRHHLPHRVADQGDHQHRDPVARRGRQDRPQRSGRPFHPARSRRRPSPFATGHGATRRSCPPGAPITIRDLLTHTAGISYGTETSVARCTRPRDSGPPPAYGWYTADKDEPICDTMERLGTLPFVAAAGRGVGLRLQHRHPRLRRREGVRHAARRVHPRRASPVRSA